MHLHQRLLGRFDSIDDPEVERTRQLFVGILDEAKSRVKNGQPYDRRETYHCRASRSDGPRTADPHYTLRAWRAVVTYLLRQEEFLYE